MNERAEVCSVGKHHNPSPSHAIGAWCQDCGGFVPLSYFDPEPGSYFVDGRVWEQLPILWDGAKYVWQRRPLSDAERSSVKGPVGLEGSAS
jgi:hypothetical protein